MNQSESDKTPEQYEGLIEKIEGERKKRLETIWIEEKIIILCKIGFLLFFLILISLGQFGIFENSLAQRFNISRAVIYIFDIDIEVKLLLSLLITAALPIITLVDESGILGRNIKISILGYRPFSVIWIVLPLDMFLTFQAVLSANKSNQGELLVHAIALAIAIIFTISSFYLSKSITAAAREWMSACKNLQIIRIYNINPVPLYKDAEQVRLIEENEAAKVETENAKEELYREKEKHQQSLESMQQEFSEQLQVKDAEHRQQLQEQETKVNKYREKIEEVSQLKSKFNQIKTKLNEINKPIQAIVDKNKEFTELDTSLKEFKFPSLDVNQNGNSKTVEKATYYWSWQNSDNSWQDLRLPSKLTVIGYSLLSTMQQQRVLPIPHMRDYAPRNELSRCLVLCFEDYKVIVYCRDEEHGESIVKWDTEAELHFKSKLIDDQSRGYHTLEFTAQEIMSNQLTVLTQIQEAINSKMGWEPN